MQPSCVQLPPWELVFSGRSAPKLEPIATEGLQAAAGDSRHLYADGGICGYNIRDLYCYSNDIINWSVTDWSVYMLIPYTLRVTSEFLSEGLQLANLGL